MITSTANAKVKQLVQLQKKSKSRREQGVFIVEGSRLLEETPHERITEVYLAESYHREHPATMFPGVSPEILADHVFTHVSDTKKPQGILGVVKMAEHAPETMLSVTHPYLLILDNLQDPGNMGTLFRTAEAAGVTGIIMSRECVDIYNPKVIRATMGSIYRMPFMYTDDLKAIIHQIKDSGIRIYAAHLDGRQIYDQENYQKKTAFMLGNEGNGLRKEIADLADIRIKIPMQGEVESLNAAIAGAVLMFEAARQRRRK